MSVQVENLSYSYGSLEALKKVSLNLPPGAVGLLGPNGAGKSTLLRILLGFLSPDEGTGRVLGYDIQDKQFVIRRFVGYMPEDDCIIPGMDAVTFTSFMAQLSGMPKQEAIKRAHEVLFYVGLEESRYRNLETYSGGMKQRLKLAQTLVHDPRLIFLDEPTSGLDPGGRKEILKLIKDISEEKNIQTFISSHILSDIEEVCSYVVILNRGQLATEGKMSNLKQLNYRLYELKVKDSNPQFWKRLKEMDCRIEETEEGQVKVYMPSGKSHQEIFKIAAEEEVQIRHFVKSQTKLEDLFAKVVGVD